MCENKNTDQCTNDCRTCDGPKLQAVDLRKRFQGLRDASFQAEQGTDLKKKAPDHLT